MKLLASLPGGRCSKYGFAALAVLASAAFFWARTADPFKRVEFRLKGAGGAKALGIAVLPKPQAKLPVVVYLPDAGGNLLEAGKELRRLAELGFAAVAVESGPTNQAVFEEQLIDLNRYLKNTTWALPNATAWVGVGLGAQRALGLALRHPGLQPRLIVAVSGGSVAELGSAVRSQRSEVGGQKSEEPSTLNPQPPTSIHCPVLLVHGDSKVCEMLAEELRVAGMPVTLRVLPGVGHDLGQERGAVMRAVAEYCAAQLPPADYWSEGKGQGAEARGRGSEVGSQSAEEAARFNLAMRRAGQHRRELWRAVEAFGEPERHTVMTVIGGLEDYDLAHITTGQLREQVKSAWRARRAYPWCRGAPLDVFERFVANRRIYEEPLPAWQPAFLRHTLPKVKYARDTEEASDAVATWLHRRLSFRIMPRERESPLPQMLGEGGGGCREEVMRYVYLGRLVGVPMRTAYTVWPTLASMHWFAEVWSTEENQWHPVDCSDQERNYRMAWVLRVPKSAVLAPTGDRGGWNALPERRWDALTNTVGLFYPSGRVAVRVVDGARPVSNQRVLAQIWLEKQVVSVVAERTEVSRQQYLLSVTAACTDASGEAHFTLGQSARHPYRLAIDKPGDPDWQWLAVQSNRTYDVTLHIEQSKPFDKSVAPPPLGFPDWKGNPAR